MAEISQSRERKGLDGQDFTRARPEKLLPDHPGDVSWEDVMNYAAQAAKWLMEQCMEKSAKTPAEALARKIEAQNIAALQNTIERMARVRKEQTAENVSKKSDDELDRELIEGLAMETTTLSERIVEAARAWIGTPYVHQASKRGAGCDCLGLLRGVWRELFGGEPESMPPYSPDWSESSGSEEMYAGFKRHLEEIDPARLAPGDIALFRMLPWGPAKHCAIVAWRFGQLTLIHSRANTRVQEEPLTDAWRKRLTFAFRL